MQRFVVGVFFIVLSRRIDFPKMHLRVRFVWRFHSSGAILTRSCKEMFFTSTNIAINCENFGIELLPSYIDRQNRVLLQSRTIFVDVTEGQGEQMTLRASYLYSN
jgi:hypothetical protein